MDVKTGVGENVYFSHPGPLSEVFRKFLTFVYEYTKGMNGFRKKPTKNTRNNYCIYSHIYLSI